MEEKNLDSLSDADRETLSTLRSTKLVAKQESLSDAAQVVVLDCQKLHHTGSRASSRSSFASQSDAVKSRHTASTTPQGFGWGAWMYLGGMFILETIVWGFASSYGVLLHYYLHSRFAQDPNANFLLPLVGTLNTGLMAFLIPVFALMLNRYPNLKSTVMYFGLALTSLSLLLSSFSTNSVHIVLTLGIGYGIGGVAVYYPPLTYLPSWFPERTGLANGIVFAGNGLGGLIFPYVIEALLARCGVESALRYLTIIVTLPVGASIYFARPNSLSASNKGCETFRQAIGDISALKAGALWTFALANVLETLSYFLPSLYLPDYAGSQGLPPFAGTACLAALNIASIISRLVFGPLADHLSTHIIGSSTSLAAAITVITFWGILNDQGFKRLIFFSSAFGFTTGSWTSLYFSVIKEWKVDDRTTMTIYGIFAFTRGFGNIISAPISSALLNDTGPITSRYSGVIVFCGASIFAAAIVEAGLFVHQLCTKKKLPLNCGSP